MPGTGRVPKMPTERRNQNPKERGEWQSTVLEGWQHGRRPPCPAGLLAESVTVWATWLGAWYASHWLPEDIPLLRYTIRLYDDVLRAIDDPFIESDGKMYRRPSPNTELRQMMDSLGITLKGQQDRRWARGQVEQRPSAKTAPAPYAELLQ